MSLKMILLPTLKHFGFYIGIFLLIEFTFSCGQGGGGGGGGSGGSSSGNANPGTGISKLSFPLQSGWIALIKHGSQIGFTVSGDCIGSADYTSSTPIPALFEGVSGVSVAIRQAISLIYCSAPPYTSGISTDYYDNNYVQLGTIVTGGDYKVFLTPPNLPVLVKVGDTGTIGTENNYTSSSNTVLDGQDVFSYVIEPDTANTAIVNMIDRSYNSVGILTSTEQDRSRIAANGNLTPVSSDIQFANGNTTHLVLTLIPNTPLFMDFTYVPTGSLPSAVAIGDVNGDGRNDVVMTTSTWTGDVVNDYKIFVFLQNATGGLDPPILYATRTTYDCLASSVAIGDINNDGKNDVVIGESGCGFEVFTQNVQGGLNPGLLYTSSDSIKVRIADLNNDGLLDVVGIGFTSTASVFLQNASGTLNAPVAYNVTHGGFHQLKTGDVNNYGLTDIVVMSGQGYNLPNLGVLTQKPDGTFNAPVYYSIGGNVLTQGVAVGDVNGDGLNDVVVTYGGNRPNSMIGVFSQNALGTLNSVVSYPSYDIPTPVEIADVTGNGLKDIITLHSGWEQAGVYVQMANGTFAPEILYGLPPFASSYNSDSLAVGDINGDGKNDIVIADPNLGLVVLYHY